MQMKIFSGDDVRAAIDMAEAIEVMRSAFAALSSGRARAPLRLSVPGEGGVHLFMPAAMEASDARSEGGSEKQSGAAVGAKVVSVHPSNPERGLPAIHAVVLALEPDTGRPLALMDGTWLTALRTGAGGGLAADLLARPDARVAAVFGAGVQARTQLQALRCVREIEEVRIVSRSGDSARAWAGELEGVQVEVLDDPAKAVRGADVIVAATDSSTPVFPGGDVEPGAHVTGVGSYTPEMREVDTELVRRARIFVDQREAVLEEAGDLAGPIADGDLEPGAIVGELGEVVTGGVEGRRSDDEITFFKSVGNAVQDVAVAARVLAVARERGLGTEVEL